MVQEVIAPAPVAPVAPAVPVAVVEAPPTPAPVIPVDGSPVPTPAVLPNAPVAEAPAPAVSPETQAYVAELERIREQSEAQTRDRMLQEQITAEVQRLESRGYTPEQAREIAVEKGEAAKREFAQERFRVGQFRAAVSIAKQYKIDPDILMSLPTPAAMHEAAKAATQQNAERTRIAQLEAEVARLKMAPAQTFASPAAAAQPGGTPYVETLKAGGALPPVKEIDRYTADWLRRQTG